MSSTTILEVAAEDFQAIELAPIGYTFPSHERQSQHQKTDAPAATQPPAQEIHESSGPFTNTDAVSISKWRASLIIGTISCVTLSFSMQSGLLIVTLPTMAHDIGLSDDLLLWPASASYLACACTLLICGSLADVVGARKMFLIGEFFLAATAVACGACKTGIESILFRVAQGIALSFCLPSSISLITTHIPSGSYRNIAFACLGAGQPLGFSIGLVLGGVFVDTVGWRWGYYTGAILTFLVFLISIFGIPFEDTPDGQLISKVFERIKTEIDWAGCLLLSTSLGMFSYVLSVLSIGTSHFLAPASLSLFSIAVALIPAFGLHIRRQERLKRKALFPTSLWTNRVFTSLCIAVALLWGVFEAMQFFLTLFYQSVQQLSAIQTSIRFLPMVITGSMANLLTGWLVKRVRADVLLLGSAAITTVAPLLMAIANPAWSYWTCAFLATAFTPVCADVMFTIANLVITSVFPPETHGLAGGVFNTVSSIGMSVGLAITSVVASSVTMDKRGSQGSTPESLMEGYRATFWLCFGADVLMLSIVGFGLRKIGKVGIKTE